MKHRYYKYTKTHDAKPQRSPAGTGIIATAGSESLGPVVVRKGRQYAAYHSNAPYSHKANHADCCHAAFFLRQIITAHVAPGTSGISGSDSTSITHRAPAM